MYYQQPVGRPTSVVVAAVLGIALAVLEVPSLAGIPVIGLVLAAGPKVSWYIQAKRRR